MSPTQVPPRRKVVDSLRCADFVSDWTLGTEKFRKAWRNGNSRQIEFKANLRKLIIAGFEQKVKKLALERATDCDDTEPNEEELKDAWEHVLDRPMGEAWLANDLDFTSLLRSNTSAGWQVNATYTRWMSEESEGPDGPEPGDLRIRYLPESDHLKWEDINPDSVSRRDVCSFAGDTTWNEALEKLGKQFDAYSTQREQYDRSLKVIKFRRRILKNVLHQFEAYGSVEEMTVERAGEITQDAPQTGSATPAKWERNAAQMYAFIESHGVPKSMSRL